MIPWTVRWRGRVSRRARGLGVLLLAVCAIVGLLLPGRDAASSGFRVVVSAEDRPLGHLLTADDVRIVDAAGEQGPRTEDPEALRDRLVGSTLAVPVGAGQQIGAGMVLGQDMTQDLPPGTVATAVRAKDAQTLGLLRPGSSVTVLGTTAEGAPGQVRGTLLWVPRQAESSGGGLMGGGTQSEASPLALVAVSPGDARTLAGLDGTATVVMDGVAAEPTGVPGAAAGAETGGGSRTASAESEASDG